MIAYTVVASHASRGVTVIPLPYPHVGVGEEGRGRQYTRVPVSQELAAGLDGNRSTRVGRASVLVNRAGNPFLSTERDSEDRRALVLVDIAAGFRGGTEWFGTAPDEPFPPAGVKVIAEGYRAQGKAGSMGSHAVRLLIMEPGTCFRVVRHGRLYGVPADRYVRWDGENLHLGTLDEVFPPVLVDADGEPL